MFYKYTFILVSNLCVLKLQLSPRGHKYMQSISTCFAFSIHRDITTNSPLSRKVTLETSQMQSHNWEEFFFKFYFKIPTVLSLLTEFNHSPCMYCKENIHNTTATVHAVACQTTGIWHEISSQIYTRTLRIWLQD